VAASKLDELTTEQVKKLLRQVSLGWAPDKAGPQWRPVFEALQSKFNAHFV
jgi:hypothetical protein